MKERFRKRGTTTACFIQMGNRQSKPLLPHYTDHLTRRRQQWPRSADGRPLMCAEVAAGIMRSCDFIAHARAFGKRRLQLNMQPQPQPFPMCLTRALYAARVGVGVGGAHACVEVTAAVRLHVRCSEVACAAVRLAEIAGADQGAGQQCQWAACIVEHVFRGHCRRVQVRQRAACSAVCVVAARHVLQ
jgi:hypothetical protein